jgi:hypothetical protein
MPLTSQDQRIIEQESVWIDSSFGGLDLSAYPALNPLPDGDFHDPRFARDYRDTPFSRNAADLRKFLRNPDSEALQRAGTEIGNEDLLDEVRDIRGREIAHEFKQQTPTTSRATATTRTSSNYSLEACFTGTIS